MGLAQVSLTTEHASYPLFVPVDAAEGVKTVDALLAGLKAGAGGNDGVVQDLEQLKRQLLAANAAAARFRLTYDF